MKPKPRSTPRAARAPHLSVETLIAWALEPGTARERRRTERHLSACSSCRALSRGAETLARALRAGRLEEVPASLHRQALRLLEEANTGARRTLRAEVEKAADVLLGTLRFVLRPGWSAATVAVPAGVRSAQAVTRCELSASGYRLEMEWQASGRSWMVRGRVLSPPRAVAQSLLIEGERGRPRRLALGPRGFFGPVHGVGGRVRARIQTERGHLVSPWIAVPAGTSSPSRRRV